MNKFAFIQRVYLENYQSFTYGKQKVKIPIIGTVVQRDERFRTT